MSAINCIFFQASFLILFNSNSILFGQNVNYLPYDWSGQFGSATVNGRLFWNTDWTSGPLLFDGTYTYYPMRYGKTINQQFSPLTIHRLPATGYQLPDTNLVTSTISYNRGDYNYNQLAVNANFDVSKRHIGLHGFKRSYAGREGQFFHPRGNTSPLQQTYRVDYNSVRKGWITDFSAARLVTESGIPDTSQVNGLYEDEILTAGFITKSPDDKLQWSSQLALFQQWRRIDASWYGDRKNQFINRGMWKQKLENFDIKGVNMSLGMDLNMQSISKTDTVQRDIDWAVVYARLKWNEIQASFGGSYFTGGNIYGNYSIVYSQTGKSMSINAEYMDLYRPTHINVWEGNPENLIERLTRGDLSVIAEFYNIKTGINYYNGAISINNLKKGDYSAVEFFSKLKILNQLTFEGSYTFQKGNFYLSDNIGRKIRFQLTYTKERFFDRFDFAAHLFGEGLLDRGELNLLSTLDGVPTGNIRSPMSLNDIWLLNFDVSATISTMTISWSVRNIFQTYEPLALQMFPDKEAGDFLIQYNTRFPPMGRLVMFGIYWRFMD